ncbi:MAG: hypothetical protein ABR569_12390, partial [Gaiellaceae bacterium]
FAQLYRIWNQDKHRTLQPTFAMVAEYNFKLAVVQDIAAVGTPRIRAGVVKDGAEVLRIPVTPDGPSPQVKLQTGITLDIGIDDGLRIPPLLASIGDPVQHILNRVSDAFPESPTFDEWRAAQEGSPPGPCSPAEG